tara:strand:- start:111 stop:425 length:315 start_codon:yes stop_codon:yes gene_type:complete
MELIKKRKERKKLPKDLISTKPNNTQKGKKRTTDTEQSLKLLKERSHRIVNRLPRTVAEKNLLKLSSKQLHRIANSLKIEGLSNLRKDDIIILIINKWNNCSTK